MSFLLLNQKYTFWLCRASRLNLCQPAEIHSFELKLKSTLPRRLWISRSCSLVSGVVQLHQGLLNGNFPKGSPQCGAHTPFIWEFWTDLTVFLPFYVSLNCKRNGRKWKWDLGYTPPPPSYGKFQHVPVFFANVPFFADWIKHKNNIFPKIIIVD